MAQDFRYTGNKCPVCNKAFNPEEDIVVCPLCGTPHHRECYKQNGECANAERHNEGYRWEPEKPQSEPAPEKAAPTPPPFTGGTIPNSREAASTVFWANQQSPFAAYPKELCEGVETEEAAEFLGMNAFKYLQNFFYEKSGKKTFNWAAFLFMPYWFFYRKMNKIGIIFMAVILGVSLLVSIPQSSQSFSNDLYEWTEKYQYMNPEETTAEQEIQSLEEFKSIFTENVLGAVLVIAQSLLGLLMRIYAGFMANGWYYKHTVAKIKEIKESTPEPQLVKLKLYKDGGMSMTRASLAVLANYVVIMALNMLFSIFG